VSRSRSLYAIARPSACRVVWLVVFNVRAPSDPTQAIGNFRQYFYVSISTLAICWYPGKILRRSSRENPSAGGVKHKRGSRI